MANTILDQEANAATLCERLNMQSLLPEIDLSSRKILNYNLTRPALQLTGFFDFFHGGRVMIFGQAEQQEVGETRKNGTWRRGTMTPRRGDLGGNLAGKLPQVGVEAPAVLD